MPFVVTATLVGSAATACGGETDSPGTAATGGVGGSGATGGGGATGGSGGTGATGGSSGTGATGGAAGGGAMGGSGGTDGGTACPPTMPMASNCTVDAGVKCSYDVECQGGKHTFVLTCEGTTYKEWTLAPQACDPKKPFDSCANTQLHCSGTNWTLPQGTNPPSPCPATLPSPGDTCYSGGFGGVWEFCGYPCSTAGGAGWTVMTCPYNLDGGQSTWAVSSACK